MLYESPIRKPFQRMLGLTHYPYLIVAIERDDGTCGVRHLPLRKNRSSKWLAVIRSVCRNFKLLKR